MINDNQKQILADALKVLADLAVAIASGGTASAVLLADVPTAKDAIERILLESPPIDAKDRFAQMENHALRFVKSADEFAHFRPQNAFQRLLSQRARVPSGSSNQRSSSRSGSSA